MNPLSPASRTAVTLTLLIAAVPTATATAQNWQMDLEVPASKYQQLFDTRTGEGYMLNNLTARTDATESHFQVTWIESSGLWQSRHDDTEASLSAFAAAQAATGYYPTFCESYGSPPNNELFASQWRHDPTMSWQLFTGLTAAQYQTEVNTWFAAGYSLHWVSAQGTGPGIRFACVFLDSGMPTSAVHNVDNAALTSFLQSHPGERVVSMCSYGPNDETFAAVVHGGTQPSLLRHRNYGMYDARIHAAEKAQAGYQTRLVDARTENGEQKFSSFRVLDSATDVWRTSGGAVSGLQAFDGIMQTYMQNNGIRQGTLAISQNGQLKLARSYTWSPATCPGTKPNTPMRIASISKPMTAVGILRLAQSGRLGAQGIDSPLGDFLDLSSWVDSRVAQITIRDLLHHRGGFDRNGPVGDPMFRDATIAGALGVSLPITTAHIIQWMATQNLDADPGTIYQYSNFGYCLLGRVIENVTGKSYEDFMYDEVTGPIGAGSMTITRSGFGDQIDNEPIYGDLPGTTGNSVLGTGASSVPVQYGGWNFPNLDAHGGWASSAPDLLRFADAMASNSPILSASSIAAMGSPHPNETASNYYSLGWWTTQNGQRFDHSGELLPDSTLTWLTRRPDGVNWCVLFSDSNSDYSIYSSIETQLDSMASWSAGNLYGDIAMVKTYGSGCAVGGEQMRLRPIYGDAPRLNEAFDFRLENLPAGFPGLPMIFAGITNQSWNGTPLPFPMVLVGAPGCFLNVAPLAIDIVTNQGGYSDASITVPNDAALSGYNLFFQGGWLGPVNAFGMATSHGMQMQIGS